jgi:CRP-like cAMP-binding protein
MNDMIFRSRLDRRVDAVYHLLLRRFQSFAQLSQTEQHALSRWATGLNEYNAGSELQRDGEPGQRPCLITQGWACCQHVFRDGRRQVISILVPGDTLDLRVHSQPLANMTTVALTRVETCDLHALRHAILIGNPAFQNLIHASAMMGALEEYHLTQQIVRLGRQTAYERLAHFLLELYHRLEAAGLAQDERFFLPLTQELLADTLGLSSVHINRTLQQLRRDKLIHWKGGLFQLLNPEELRLIADFGLTASPPPPLHLSAQYAEMA